MCELKVGDTIRCHDTEDMINCMAELAKAGIETDFCYERGGEKGYWLEVTRIDKL